MKTFEFNSLFGVIWVLVAIFSIGAKLPAAEPAPSAMKTADDAKIKTEKPPIKPKKSNKIAHQKILEQDLLTGDARDTLKQALKSMKTAQAVVANNIANAETPGFKKSRAIFADSGYRHETLPGAQDSAGAVRAHGRFGRQRQPRFGDSTRLTARQPQTNGWRIGFSHRRPRFLPGAESHR